MHARPRKQATLLDRVMEELAAILWVAALSLLAFSGVRAAVGMLSAPAERPEPRMACTTVQRGDSLWRIALRSRRPGEDPRRLVAAMCATNRIHPNHVLQPGDRIFIPQFAAPETARPETVLAER